VALAGPGAALMAAYLLRAAFEEKIRARVCQS
jgi:hypothetical protein